MAVRGPANNSLSLSPGKAFFLFISLCSCYPLLLSSDTCFLDLSCMCLAYVLFNFVASTHSHQYVRIVFTTVRTGWSGLDGSKGATDCLPYNAYVGCGTHLGTCLRSAGNSFRRATGMSREINHSPPCSIEVKYERCGTSPRPPPYACMSHTVACSEMQKKCGVLLP